MGLLGLLGLLCGQPLPGAVSLAALGRRRGPGRASPLRPRGGMAAAGALLLEIVLTLSLTEQHLVEGEGRLVHLRWRARVASARGRA